MVEKLGKEAVMVQVWSGLEVDWPQNDVQQQVLILRIKNEEKQDKQEQEG